MSNPGTSLPVEPMTSDGFIARAMREKPGRVAPVVVEVLSAPPHMKDTVDKLDGCFSLAAVRHYLIVDAVKRRVVLHSRKGDGIATAILGGGAVTPDPPGRAVDLDVFWEGIPT